MREIEIINAHGERLAGCLHPANSRNLAIVCHGRLCTKDTHFLPALCAMLQSRGLNAFRFDFAGSGASEGVFEESTVTKGLADLEAVVTHFQPHYTIHTLVGHSQGAVEVLLYQAQKPVARRIVAIAGVVDQARATRDMYTVAQIAELDTRGFLTVHKDGGSYKISKQYFYDRLRYGDISEHVRQVAAPVLVVQGTKDEIADRRNGERMMFVLDKRGELALVAGADHLFTDRHHELIGAIANWLAQAEKEQADAEPGRDQT
jgi:alpha/beta superfamily hydrolase